jgi:ribosomal protein S18 acetylase RimI-like enzyme
MIYRFLREDYFDYPVCLFTRRLTSAAALWLAASADVYFVVAHVEDRPVGFVFAHTLGYRLWRKFAGQHPALFPHTFWVLAKLRLFRRWSYPHTRFAHARPHDASTEMAELRLPKSGSPFIRQEPDGRTGFVDLVYVANESRGRSLGSRMLEFLVCEMDSRGLRSIVAHIDPQNYASARAFLKAGWTVLETSTRDLLATVNCSHEQQ